MDETNLKIINMSDVESKEISWLWYPFIPYGKLTIIQGDPGEGKEMSGDLEKEIEIAMGEKEKSDGLGMLDVEDIKLAFIQKLVGDRGVFTKIQVNNTTYTKSEILKDEFSLSQMGTGTATFFYYPFRKWIL